MATGLILGPFVYIIHFRYHSVIFRSECTDDAEFLRFLSTPLPDEETDGIGKINIPNLILKSEKEMDRVNSINPY
jgi:hypothetical protein